MTSYQPCFVCERPGIPSARPTLCHECRVWTDGQPPLGKKVMRMLAAFSWPNVRAARDYAERQPKARAMPSYDDAAHQVRNVGTNSIKWLLATGFPPRSEHAAAPVPPKDVPTMMPSERWPEAVQRAMTELARVHADTVEELRDLRDIADQLRRAFDLVAPRCAICDGPLTPAEVLALHGPGEVVEYLHGACVLDDVPDSRSFA